MAEKNEQATDIQMAGSLVIAGLLSEQGLQALQQVLQGAKDPVAAIGNAVFMALSVVRDKLDQQGLSIDDKLWVARGGVLDRVVFEVLVVLKEVLGVQEAKTPQFAAGLKESIMQLMTQEEQGGPPQQSGMPPQGMPMQGGGMPQGGPQGPPSALLGGV